MAKARVLIAEDYLFFQEMLEQLISDIPGVEVVGKSSERRQAIEAAMELAPDILIIDICLLGSRGLDAVSEIRQELPDAQIVVIGDEGGDEYFRAAYERGAAAYIVKEAMHHQLIPALDVLASRSA